MRNPRVGRRQILLLRVLAARNPDVVTVGEAMDLAGLSVRPGSAYDSIRGLANRGLIRHACHPDAVCQNPGRVMQRYCYVRIAPRGWDASPSKVGRPSTKSRPGGSPP